MAPLYITNKNRQSGVLEPIIKRVEAGDSLSPAEMSGAMDLVMAGQAPEEQVERLLRALHAKGETAEEIAGAASAMRRAMTAIRSNRNGLIDTCGTGGGGSHYFNISTATAIVVAAAGSPVAKHGNRRVTSKSGSADVLAELGVNIDADVACVERCLDELGICFCFAPLLHRAMKHVASVRKRIETGTIFNLLGPLTNPAGARFQLLGVGRPGLRRVLAESLAILGVEQAAVVTGEDGLGEVTLAAPTSVSLVRGAEVAEIVWQPKDFGLRMQPLNNLVVDGPAASAAIVRKVFDGEKGAARDIVVLNAAAALWTAKAEDDLKSAAERAAGAIDSHAAKNLLARLAILSHQS